METEKIKQLFDQFIKDYQVDIKNGIWQSHSKKFNSFWTDRIISGDSRELADQEIDEIVRILDKKGKGNTSQDQAIGLIMIPQGVWRRMFNELKKNQTLAKLINDIFEEQSSDRRAKLIDKLYEVNKGKKNHLTGQSGNAINCLLAAHDPFKNLSIVSIKDRLKIIDFLGIDSPDNYETLTTGEKFTKSSKDISAKFEKLGILHNARTISLFCYSDIFKPLWRDSKDFIQTEVDIEIEEQETKEEIKITNSEETSLFYMENQLEDFLIKNWDKTELGKKYDLIEENGDLVSQQYRTPIGRIDILATDKKTGDYVVIELKRDQTSDNTVGQLLRYMGWVEENLSKGKESKGIIIAAYFDEKLHYAIKKVPSVEVFSYKIEFKLDEFKR